MAKRLKAEERRASILAVAKVLFADKGYHGVAVDDIARRLGVSPAVLYQHFSSKEALYEAVVETLSAHRESYVEAALAEPDDFGSILRRMTHVFIENALHDPDYLRMELLSTLEDPGTAQRFFENRWKGLTDFIEFSIRELRQTQQLNKVEPRMASLLYQSMIREIVYSKCLLDAEHLRAYNINFIADQLLDMFLHAIGYPINNKEGTA